MEFFFLKLKKTKQNYPHIFFLKIFKQQLNSNKRNVTLRWHEKPSSNFTSSLAQGCTWWTPLAAPCGFLSALLFLPPVRGGNYLNPLTQPVPEQLLSSSLNFSCKGIAGSHWCYRKKYLEQCEERFKREIKYRKGGQ